MYFRILRRNSHELRSISQYAEIFSQQLNKITKKFTLEIITVLKLVKVTFSEKPKLLGFNCGFNFLINIK